MPQAVVCHAAMGRSGKLTVKSSRPFEQDTEKGEATAPPCRSSWPNGRLLSWSGNLPRCILVLSGLLDPLIDLTPMDRDFFRGRRTQAAPCPPRISTTV